MSVTDIKSVGSVSKHLSCGRGMCVGRKEEVAPSCSIFNNEEGERPKTQIMREAYLCSVIRFMDDTA